VPPGCQAKDSAQCLTKCLFFGCARGFSLLDKQHFGESLGQCAVWHRYTPD